MTMPDKISVGPDMRATEGVCNYDGYATYHRTPATLDEALRDYAMFGKFVATHPWGTVDEMTDYIADWEDGYHYDLFAAFVKEEMGDAIPTAQKGEA